MRQQTEELIDAARRANWSVVKNRGHYSMKSPDGKTIIVSSSTPSDVRSVKNLRARLRRAGLDI